MLMLSRHPSLARIHHALVLAVGLWGVFLTDRTLAGAVAVDEAKAEFVFRIAQFVDWSELGSKEALVIGVVGDASFAQLLKEVVKGRSIQGIPVTVREASDWDELGPVQVVFLGGGNRRRLSTTIERLPRRTVLTLGDSEAFLKAGGMISMLVSRAGTIHLSARKDLLDNSGLKVSSRLMRILSRK